MMMTSGSGVNYKSMFDAGSQVIKLLFLDALNVEMSNLAYRLLPRKELSHCSKVLVPISFVVWLVLVCCLSTTNYKKLCSAKFIPEVIALSILLSFSSSLFIRFRLKKADWDISTFTHAFLLRTFIKHRPSFSLFSCQLGMVDNTLVNAKISVEQIKIIICFSVIVSYDLSNSGIALFLT